MIPSSAVSQRRSISLVKCLASRGEWITSRVSSLVCAAEGDQLKVPVECIDLDVAGNDFQILQRFDVSFVKLDRLDGGC